MSSLNNKQICIVPWTHYTLTHNTLTTCCWLGGRYSFIFGDYRGPWQGDFWLVNPKVIEHRTNMLKNGVSSACPDICPKKRNLPSVLKQLEELVIDDNSFQASQKIAHMIENDIADQPVYPLYLGISPGVKCNHRCIYCTIEREKAELKRQKATVEEWKRLKPLYKNCIDFRTVGGDTFGQTDEVLEMMYGPIWNKKGIKAGVITNGAGLTLERYEKFCVNGPINDIFISVDSLDKDTYQTLHQRPIEPMMKNLFDITDKYKDHCISKLSMVVTTINIQEIPDLVALAIDRNVPTVYFRLVIPTRLARRNASYLFPGNRKEAESLMKEYLKIKGKVKELDENNDIKIINFDFLEKAINRLYIGQKK